MNPKPNEPRREAEGREIKLSGAYRARKNSSTEWEVWEGCGKVYKIIVGETAFGPWTISFRSVESEASRPHREALSDYLKKKKEGKP